jgi:CRP/FNR family transcriptional regulator, cyclic AMP receptor protein
MAERPVVVVREGVWPMLQKLTEEIAECYAHASECRERAKPTLDPATNKDLLEMEQRWLSLAHRYETAERLAFDSPSNHDEPPNHSGGTVLASAPRRMSSRVAPMSARKHVADKLLWQMLERWKRSSPELDRIQFLKTVPFFNELSHRQLKTVSDIMFERTFETDELIFTEGQPGAALFLILDGKVAVEMCRENHTTILAILEKGAFLGEMALLNEAPRSANARSLQRTYTLALYRNDLSRLIQRDPQTACQIYRALASIVGDRLRSTNELIQTESSTEV